MTTLEKALCILSCTAMGVVVFLSFITLMQVDTKKQPTETVSSIIEERQEIIKPEEDLLVSYIGASLANEVRNKAQEYEFPEWFILAVYDTESDMHPLATSNKGEKYGKGGFQVSDISLREYNNYHKEKYSNEDMYDIYKNMEVAIWYMSILKNKYLSGLELDFSDLYMAYNTGPTYYKKYHKSLKIGWYYNEQRNKWEKYNALNRYLEKEEKIKNILDI